MAAAQRVGLDDRLWHVVVLARCIKLPVKCALKCALTRLCIWCLIYLDLLEQGMHEIYQASIFQMVQV